RATRLAMDDPVRDELVDGLPLAHLAQVEDERPARRIPLAERLGVVPGRCIETDTQDLARDVLVPEARMHETLLLGREESERARKLEQHAVRDEPERLLVVRRRDERGALRDERQARRCRLVYVRVEEDRVVAVALGPRNG